MTDEQSTIRALSIINFILGVWLIISPFMLGYSSSQAAINQIILGAIISILGVIRFFANAAIWTSWLKVIAAAWLIVAPFALAYSSSAAYWNEIIVGVIVLIASTWNTALSTSPSHLEHRAGV